MKTKKTFLTLLFFITLFASTLVQAQDPMKVAPDVYEKIVLENDKVRVMEIEFKPGEVAPVHSHPDHIVYVLSAGKLKITNAEGKETEADLKIGDSMFIKAETHSAVNNGTTILRAIVVELK